MNTEPNRQSSILLIALTTILAAFSTVIEAKEHSEAGPELNEREQAFVDRMNNALFVGRWCLVKEGQMGEDRADEYVIQSASKVEGDDWVITTRMKFGGVDVNVNVPVQVKWAGDTPVISVTDVKIPQVGEYSARVAVDGDQYGGSWRGVGYGGLMYGVIKKQESESAEASESPENSN